MMLNIRPISGRQAIRPHFAGYCHKSRTDGQQLIHATSLFREAEVFKALPNALRKRFPPERFSRVPIYSYGCSNGSEPFSLAAVLLDRLGQDADRFDVFGRDIGTEAITQAASGELFLEKHDLEGYRNVMNRLPFEACFKALPEPERFAVQPAIRDRVRFSVGDILADAARPDAFPEPCVLLFRNAWYLLRENGEIGEPVHRRLAGNLFRNLKPGSLVILGETDTRSYNGQRPQETTVVRALRDAGFRPIHTPGLYPVTFERP